MKLYHHTHNKTGKKYLGITSRDLKKYKGSSKDWLEHLRQHGDDYSTEILCESDDQEYFRDRCRYFSEKFDVQNNPEYFNLLPEQGGFLGGKSNPNYKDGALVGQYDNPNIRKSVDKVRNHERHKEWKKPNNIRDRARYYFYRGKLDRSKELFEEWQDLRMDMPMSSKGNYVRTRIKWEDWISGLSINTVAGDCKWP